MVIALMHIIGGIQNNISRRITISKYCQASVRLSMVRILIHFSGKPLRSSQVVVESATISVALYNSIPDHNEDSLES